MLFGLFCTKCNKLCNYEIQHMLCNKCTATIFWISSFQSFSIYIFGGIGYWKKKIKIQPKKQSGGWKFPHCIQKGKKRYLFWQWWCLAFDSNPSTRSIFNQDKMRSQLAKKLWNTITKKKLEEKSSALRSIFNQEKMRSKLANPRFWNLKLCGFSEHFQMTFLGE